MYALQEVPGKGKGLVATRKISKGTRILSEEPIVRVPEVVLDSQTLPASIRRQVDALTPDQRRAFLSLHNILHRRYCLAVPWNHPNERSSIRGRCEGRGYFS